MAQDWALAYRQFSNDYVAREGEAQEARLGMWREPWDWRREGDPVAAYRTGANELQAQYAAFTVPNIDPVLSDHVSGELGDALDRLLQLIGEMLGVGKSTT